MKTSIVFLITLFAILHTESARSLDFSPNHSVTLCGPTDVFFVCQSSQTVDNIWWDFGDGFTDNRLNPVHHYTEPGVYDVKMVVEYNGVKDSVTKQAFVELKQLPDVAFSVSREHYQIPYVRIFTYSGTSSPDSIVAYRWKVESVLVSEQPRLKYTFSGNDIYTVSLEVTNQSGCTRILDSVIEINDVPIPQTTVAELGNKDFSCAMTQDGKGLLIERNGMRSELLRIRILDMTGRLLHESALESNRNSLTIELPYAFPALYIVELSSLSFEAAVKIHPRYL